ncbi:MAG: hypothetical protein HY721_04605 [Planctomycetes bacterium]|nr:hypothetical protein [Planctomycetota bacterium]
MTRATPPRPLRTGSVRRAVAAPELERYLSRGSVDLAVTDQLEALQVRVRRGVDVLETKLAEGLRAARREITSQSVRTGAFAAMGAFLAVKMPPWELPWGLPRGESPAAPLLWAALGLILVRVVFGIAWIARAAADRTRLADLQGRHAGIAERARTAEELLALSEQALADAHAIGAVPDGN